MLKVLKLGLELEEGVVRVILPRAGRPRASWTKQPISVFFPSRLEGFPVKLNAFHSPGITEVSVEISVLELDIRYF